MRRKLLCFTLFAVMALFTAASPLAMADTAPQISGVAVTNLTDTAATITWTTDISSNSKVQYSTTTNPPLSTDPTIAVSTLVTAHAVQLAGLSPGTQYFYSVTSCSILGNCSTASSFGFITLAVPGTWKQVASPSITSTNSSLTIDNHLLAITATSLTDAWAVGWSNNPNGPQYSHQTLIEHWDGSKWSIVPSPNANADQSELYGVAAVSATDVWAVGRALNASSPPSTTLVEHWDGISWTVVPSPSPDSNSNELYAVVASSANDIWASGFHQAVPYTTTTTQKVHGKVVTITTTVNPKAETFVLHWDGALWTQVPSPNPNLENGFNNGIFGMTKISPTDIWAVGFSGNTGTFFEPLALHWDGAAWNAVPAVAPSTGAIGDSFVSVSGVASNDIWAVGYTEGSTRTFPVLEHWDGTQWTKSSFRYSTTTNSLYTSLYSVSAVKSDFAWAVGEISGAPFILQWNGTVWNQVPAATLQFPTNTLQAVEALDTSHAFAAGRLYPNNNSGLKTLIEIYSVP